ncbi:unnamed protein product [Periconia digitata]|uniref:Uncharacterized protein n=1 Tax=Periconia digitata TaxID=1303443 RepID=A0A9W4XIM6_9PLEO|nr:unnamed protein product [Periconia digitata]
MVLMIWEEDAAAQFLSQVGKPGMDLMETRLEAFHRTTESLKARENCCLRQDL